ncbi:hypothetical protein Avbf_02076 [Armadillidium vulgare]|nr:hypothetical protein Avbf_02076 [Armadillidium vulgare]
MCATVGSPEGKKYSPRVGNGSACIHMLVIEIIHDHMFELIARVEVRLQRIVRVEFKDRYPPNPGFNFFFHSFTSTNVAIISLSSVEVETEIGKIVIN